MSAEIGTLAIVVLKAQNLNDIHSFSKQDAYGQLSLNGTVKRTPVDKRAGQHPLWDAEVRYPIMKDKGEKYRMMEISCWADEPRDDVLLGKATLDITETLRTGEFDGLFEYTFTKSERISLTVELCLQTGSNSASMAPIAARSISK
jgi:Ca2+-dependent lipid-binding protein